MRRPFGSADLPIFDFAYRPMEPHELDRLGQTKSWAKALVVRSNYPALQVADLVDLNNMSLILTVNEVDAVEGVIVPQAVRARAAQVLPGVALAGNFSNIVSEIIKRRSPGGHAGFDWLTSRGPDLYWCDRGKHMTTEKNCTEDHSQ